MQSLDFDRVLESAADVFATHGFDGVGMRELSDKCQVSVPTLYYYFGSKEKLFEAVCHDKYRKAIDFVSKSVNFDSDVGQQIERLSGQLFDLLTNDRTLFLLLRRDLVHGSISKAEFRSQLQYQGLIEIFRKLLRKLHSESTAERMAFTASALVFGYCEFVHVSQGTASSFGFTSVQDHRQELLRAMKSLTAPVA